MTIQSQFVIFLHYVHLVLFVNIKHQSVATFTSIRSDLQELCNKSNDNNCLHSFIGSFLYTKKRQHSEIYTSAPQQTKVSRNNLTLMTKSVLYCNVDVVKCNCTDQSSNDSHHDHLFTIYLVNSCTYALVSRCIII